MRPIHRENTRPPKKILRWLVAAARPLDLDELHAALSIEVDEPKAVLKPRQRDPEGLISLCGPLVRLVSQGGSAHQQLSLAHFSVKEYLISGAILASSSLKIHKYNVDLLHAHLYFAKVSLTCMLSKEAAETFDKGIELDDIRKRYRLLDYAVMYGSTHLRPLLEADDKLIELLNGIFLPRIEDRAERDNRDEELMERLRQLLLSGTENEDGTFEIDSTMVGSLNDIALFASSRRRPSETTIHCKLFLELFAILNDWQQKEHPPEISPLYYASLFGWKPGVKRILELDPKQRKKHVLNHALRAAAVGGFADVIVLLHQAGADSNAYLGYELGSPLQSAACVGNEEAVRKLLDLGADPNSDEPFHRTGGTVGSALQGAALSDNESLVQLLIDKGADINSNKGWLGTPLQAVLEAGKLRMSLFLIENPKFNPNVTGGYYGSASRFCCFEGFNAIRKTNEVLKAIMDKGGSPSERVGPYGSLLEIACHFGHVEKVTLLLERGAVPGLLSAGTFGNATHAAAMSGNQDIVDLLFSYGADPNCPGCWIGCNIRTEERTPGTEMIVLQQGTGFLAFDHSRITEAFFAPMLHSALRICEVDHNKIFLIFEDEITHREGHLGNPLQGAAFRGYSRVIKSLIKHEAKVDGTGGFFGTALQAAASQGNLEAVETLLEHGADPNIVYNGHYGTALAAAIALKFDKVVSLLIPKMANPRIVDDHGWSAKTWSVLQDWTPPNASLEINEQCRSPSRWNSRYRSSQPLVDEETASVEFRDEIQEYGGR